MTGKEYADKTYPELSEGLKGMIAKAYDDALVADVTIASVWEPQKKINLTYTLPCSDCPRTDPVVDCSQCFRNTLRPKQSEVVLTKSEEKHWRPFKDCEELISAWERKVFIPVLANHTSCMFKPSIWVKSKVNGTENLITAFDNDNESIGGSCVFLQDFWLNMNDLFNGFTFLDNSPCGCEEE